MVTGLVIIWLASAGAAAQQAGDALQAQAAAWNRGDLEEALGAYCDRPDIVWVNRRGVTRGFKDFAQGMRSDFKDRARMGRMDIELLDSRSVARNAALTTIKWQISRDGKRLMGGVSTQLWQRCSGRLRIVLEHAS